MNRISACPFRFTVSLTGGMVRAAAAFLLVVNLVTTPFQARAEAEFADEHRALAEISALTAPPKMSDADGYPAAAGLKAVYLDGLPWQGKPTRFFAWLGLPQQRRGKVPGIVLVHGGGGSAFQDWVKQWTARGFAAISIAVEGQTDQKDPAGKWEKHAWSGPQRAGVYGDSEKPIRDQWIYHAVADTVLANSLLRSLPEVDPDKVGVMGVSWGGIIVSTVIGIDTRFAFAIPVYGCGHLFDTGNHYERILANSRLYREVWDPIQRLANARMPVLWFSWPQDKHFPLGCQAASYHAAGGTQTVALVPNMGHGQGPPVARPESYAFAEAVVTTGRPWCRQAAVATRQGNRVQVSFAADKPLDRAVLVSTVDTGPTGDRAWTETAATLTRQGTGWLATADLPADTTAWFINVQSGPLVASSFYEVND